MTTDPQTFRHRSEEVEAVQWTGSNAEQLRAFCGPDFDEIDLDDRIEDPDQTAAVREADHGTWRGLAPGDWVVKLEEGLYEFAAADFVKQYEPAAPAAVPPADRAGLRDWIADAVVPLLLDTLPKVIARSRGYEVADAMLALLPADSEPHRLALSDALGLGTSAPWDAIRERAAELHNGAGTPQPETQAARCGPAPDECDAEAGEPCADHEREQAHAEGEHAFCGPECCDAEPTDAHPAERTWAAELRDPLTEEWVPGTRYITRDRAANALAHARSIGPTWKDGTPTERRLVRATTTYTVEDEAPREIVHACPPDGSGLTPCCGRTPFELPLGDRMSTDPDAVTCAAPAVTLPGKEA